MDKKSKTEIALEIIQGKWGNGEVRKSRLEKAGYNYREVQDEVNRILYGGKNNNSNKKSNTQIALEVLEGKWGNGEERKRRLESQGYNYREIQNEVNRMLCGGNVNNSNKKSNNEIAKEVINGLWGNGEERKRKLENEGYNYKEIQNEVNRILSH